MRRGSAAREFVIAGLAVIIAVATGIDWTGKPLRMVHVVTLVAAGMVAGAGLARGLARLRRKRMADTGETAA